jgi:hypothetical protein
MVIVRSSVGAGSDHPVSFVGAGSDRPPEHENPLYLRGRTNLGAAFKKFSREILFRPRGVFVQCRGVVGGISAIRLSFQR